MINAIKINAIKGQAKIIGAGWETIPHWVRCENIQIVTPSTADEDVSILVLSSNTGKIAEVMVFERPESLAYRWINVIVDPDPITQKSLLV